MAAVLEYDITINVGSTYRQQFLWESGTPAVPVDNTGFSARMHVRTDYGAATTILELTETPNANGDRISLGGANGQIEIYISDETTTAVTETGGVYDLEMEAPSNGDVTRLLQGAVVFDPEVTT